jgi:hypothetical protein
VGSTDSRYGVTVDFCEYVYETSGYKIAVNLLAEYQLSNKHPRLAGSCTSKYSTSVFKAWAQQLTQLYRSPSNTVIYLVLVSNHLNIRLI